jgi:hypothetical protein
MFGRGRRAKKRSWREALKPSNDHPFPVGGGLPWTPGQIRSMRERERSGDGPQLAKGDEDRPRDQSQDPEDAQGTERDPLEPENTSGIERGSDD